MGNEAEDFEKEAISSTTNSQREKLKQKVWKELLDTRI